MLTDLSPVPRITVPIYVQNNLTIHFVDLWESWLSVFPCYLHGPLRPTRLWTSLPCIMISVRIVGRWVEPPSYSCYPLLFPCEVPSRMHFETKLSKCIRKKAVIVKYSSTLFGVWFIILTYCYAISECNSSWAKLFNINEVNSVMNLMAS